MNTLLKLTPVVLLLLLFAACETTEVEQNHSESIPTVNVTSSVTPKVSNEPPVFENIENYQSSLDDGRGIFFDNLRFSDNRVFKFNPLQKKYIESEHIRDYFEMGNDGGFTTYKIFEYKDNIVVVARHKFVVEGSYGLVGIHNQTTNKNTIIKVEVNNSNRDCYLLGNKLYFSEIIRSNGQASNQFVIKYMDLDTFEVNNVCSYSAKDTIDYGNFSVRKDGAVALMVKNENVQCNIVTWNSGLFEEVVESVYYLELIEYDNHGVYYIAPAKNSRLKIYDVEGKVSYIDLDKIDDEVRKDNPFYSFDSYEFILHAQNEKETVLLKSTGEGSYKINGNGIKVFQDYFVRIQYEEIEKYDFTGQLIKKIPLKQWPIVSKGRGRETYVTYVNGEMVNVCYQRETNELDMEIVNLD